MARVLVIDDDAEIREMLEQTLKAAGCEVISVANGKLGLERQLTFQANLVITDLFMPEKEGLETIMELRRDFPTVAIIAISGNPKADKMLLAAQRLGAVRSLGKPFQPHELLAAVEDVLRDRKMTG